MICPTCNGVMIVVEHNRIELDYCPGCQGVWFDSGEMELWLESMGRASPSQFLSDNSKETESPEKKRKCPICRRQMKKTTFGAPSEILIDQCRRGDGWWFDGGEISKVIKGLITQPPQETGSQPPLITFLGEVFQAGQ